MKFIGWDFSGFWNCFPWLKKWLPAILDPRGNKSIRHWDQKSLCRTTVVQKTQNIAMNFCIYLYIPYLPKGLLISDIQISGFEKVCLLRKGVVGEEVDDTNLLSLVLPSLHRRQQMSSTGWSTGVYTNRFRLIGIRTPHIKRIFVDSSNFFLGDLQAVIKLMDWCWDGGMVGCWHSKTFCIREPKYTGKSHQFWDGCRLVKGEKMNWSGVCVDWFGMIA